MEKGKSATLFGLEFNNVVDTIAKLLILYLLLGWSADILKPFLIILVWGGIIAIAIHPLFVRITKWFKGRKTLSSVLLTLMLLGFLIVPGWMIIDSLLEGVQHLRVQFHNQAQLIPPPGPSAQEWPSLFQPLVKLWSDASANLEKVIRDHSEQVGNAALWVFGALTGFGKGLLLFLASIIISGIYLVYSDPIHKSSISIFKKLAGDRGEHFLEVSVATIQNVVKGILGVAVIQAAMASLGFFIAGIPFAGLWTILCLILAIVQVGAGPVIIPLAIYMFTVSSTFSATVFSIWMVLVLVIDNFLKPILLGRGAPAPMLVIFLGAIGGFISHGFVGLFLGAVILTLAYKLFNTWLQEDDSEENLQAQSGNEPTPNS